MTTAMTDWHEIVSTHEAMLWRTVYRVLNHRDDALDCCQQVLLDAYKYSLNREVDDWGALLTTLASRRAIDRLRMRVRARKNLVSLNDANEPATDADCPIEFAVASELMEQLRNVVVDLPEKQAEVFWLSCIEGLSHQQIGQELTISPNESRVLLHRARHQLTSKLDFLDARRTT